MLSGKFMEQIPREFYHNCYLLKIQKNKYKLDFILNKVLDIKIFFKFKFNDILELGIYFQEVPTKN